MSSNIVVYIIMLALAVALISVVVSERRREREMQEKLSSLLDRAINGEFFEEVFDESEYSALEAKLGTFLKASSTSARNLSEEKSKIKELIGDISHQTKTPIANILLYSQLLAEQELPGSAGDCVTAIGAQAEKLSFLIGSLVKTSRLETGIFTLSPTINSVGELIADAAAQIAPKAADKGIEVEIRSGDAVGVFDKKWTAEALYNVLDNAVKYTPAGGHITVSAENYELFCRVDVADTGIGVTPEEQTKIFTRFYRSPEVAGMEGVGIGLYLAREILSGQRGYIKAASEKGKGSTFSLYLPRK